MKLKNRFIRISIMTLLLTVMVIPSFVAAIPASMVKAADVLEDFTTADWNNGVPQADPESDLGVTANKVTFGTVDEDYSMYFYRDYGADYFDGDFSHKVEVAYTAYSGQYGRVMIDMLANAIGDFNTLDVANESLITFGIRTQTAVPMFVLYEVDSGAAYVDNTGDLTQDTLYYIQFERDESIGTYGTIYAYICTGNYTDNGGTPFDTLSLELHTSKKDYRYRYSIANYNGGVGGKVISGYLQNLALESEGSTTPTVTTSAVSDSSYNSVTGNGNITNTGGANITTRGFHHGRYDEGLTANVSENGNWGTGVFDLPITGLDEGTGHSYRAFATNENGTSYGSTVNFTTEAHATTDFEITETGKQYVTLGWDTGGGTYYEVKYSYIETPSDNTSGYTGYWGTGDTVTISPISSNNTVYFRLFTHLDDSTMSIMTDNLTANTTTLERSFPEYVVEDTYEGVMIGDSLFTDTYAGVTIGEKLEELTGYNILDKGVGSETSVNISARFNADVIANSPNFVVIEGGLNDDEGEKAAFISAWTSMLDASEADESIDLVIITLIMPCTDASDEHWAVIDDWNESLVGLSDNYTKTVVVDTSSWLGMYRDDGAVDNMWDIETSLDHDGVHLNATGNFWAAKSFSTAFPLELTVTTSAASETDCNSTTGNGEIIDIGEFNVTYRGIQYKTSGDWVDSDNVSESGNWGTGVFDLAITGLDDDTEYQHRAFAQNSVNISYGSTVNFTTLASNDPTFVTGAATLITDTTARLNGTISALDCDQADDTYWQLGLSSGSYGVANYTDTTNRANGAVYYNISSLTANTTYFFRGAARLNGGAWSYGGELSFTTDNTTPAAAPVNYTGLGAAVFALFMVLYAANALMKLTEGNKGIKE